MVTQFSGPPSLQTKASGKDCFFVEWDKPIFVVFWIMNLSICLLHWTDKNFSGRFWTRWRRVRRPNLSKLSGSTWDRCFAKCWNKRQIFYSGIYANMFFALSFPDPLHNQHLQQLKYSKYGIQFAITISSKLDFHKMENIWFYAGEHCHSHVFIILLYNLLKIYALY